MATRERLICASEQLAEAGTGVRFETRYLGETAQAFAIRYRGVARAYLNRCAHVPVEMDFELGEFFDRDRQYLICSVHGALYDPASGACLLGRCNGRGLIAVELVERDGAVYLLED